MQRRAQHLSPAARQRADAGRRRRPALRFRAPAGARAARRGRTAAAAQGADRRAAGRRNVGRPVRLPARADAAGDLRAAAGARAPAPAPHDRGDAGAPLRGRTGRTPRRHWPITPTRRETGNARCATPGAPGSRRGRSTRRTRLSSSSRARWRRPTTSPSPTPVGVRRARGLAYETLGDFERARADYEAALRGARARCDQRAEWQALLDLGAFWAAHDYARAGEYLRQALDLARALDDPASLAHSLNRLGNWLANTGHPVEGCRRHREALALFETLGDRPGIADTLDLLGMAHVLSGDRSRRSRLRAGDRPLPRARRSARPRLQPAGARPVRRPALTETTFAALWPLDDCAPRRSTRRRGSCASSTGPPGRPSSASARRRPSPPSATSARRSPGREKRCASPPRSGITSGGRARTATSARSPSSCWRPTRRSSTWRRRWRWRARSARRGGSA